jgi:hypothetical protein
MSAKTTTLLLRCDGAQPVEPSHQIGNRFSIGDTGRVDEDGYFCVVARKNI